MENGEERTTWKWPDAAVVGAVVHVPEVRTGPWYGLKMEKDGATHGLAAMEAEELLRNYGAHGGRLGVVALDGFLAGMCVGGRLRPGFAVETLLDNAAGEASSRNLFGYAYARGAMMMKAIRDSHPRTTPPWMAGKDEPFLPLLDVGAGPDPTGWAYGFALAISKGEPEWASVLDDACQATPNIRYLLSRHDVTMPLEEEVYVARAGKGIVEDVHLAYADLSMKGKSQGLDGVILN